MTLTITISDRLGQAVKNKGAEFELDGPGYVKAMLFAATQAQAGVLLQLDLPPMSLENDPALPLLPLGGGATANDVVPLKTV